jgi:hypothetical protein
MDCGTIGLIAEVVVLGFEWGLSGLSFLLYDDSDAGSHCIDTITVNECRERERGMGAVCDIGAARAFTML